LQASARTKNAIDEVACLPLDLQDKVARLLWEQVCDTPYPTCAMQQVLRALRAEWKKLDEDTQMSILIFVGASVGTAALVAWIGGLFDEE
jgi:hypothetical protein